MSSTPTRCIALTKELDAYIRGQVASGHYTSASEVVRAALRVMIKREGAYGNDTSPAELPMPLRVALAPSP